MAFNLDDYEPVEDRLAKFWADHPDGKVLTELVSASGDGFIVKAFVFKVAPSPVQITEFGTLATDRTAPDATGLAQESVAQSGVNKTSALENCETSAIGRALANLGYAAKTRASREEMEKVTRQEVVPDHGEWMKNAVQSFKKWNATQRKEAYKAVMLELGLESMGSMDDAKAIHQGMAAAYAVEFPPTGDEAPF